VYGAFAICGAIAAAGSLALHSNFASAQSAPDAGRPATQDAGRPAADAGPAATPQPTIAAEPSAYTGPAPYILVTLPRLNNNGLNPQAIQRVVNRQKEGIVNCYKRLLAVAPRAQGQLQLHFDVIAGGSGLIDRVHMTPHRNGSFESCARDVISAWSWSNPRGVPSVTIDLNIDLAPEAPARPAGRGH
jgi:hypothetical protein